MFELDSLIADCRDAVASDPGHKAIAELVARAVSDPAEVLKKLGEPERAGVYALHRSDTLTVLNVVWGPMMTLMPHNHEMWAVIGIYTGREDNIFWRRIDGTDGGDASRIEAPGPGTRPAVSI